MNRSEKWKDVIRAGECGLKEQFDSLTEEEISTMNTEEIILECYKRMLEKEKEN